MIRVLVETRKVYRSEVGRKGRFTRKAAYRDAAWEAWKAKYPCECEHETHYVCWQHQRDYEIGPDGEALCGDPTFLLHGEYRRRVVDRLARWLMWRDSRRRTQC